MDTEDGNFGTGNDNWVLACIIHKSKQILAKTQIVCFFQVLLHQAICLVAKALKKNAMSATFDTSHLT